MLLLELKKTFSVRQMALSLIFWKWMKV